MDKNVFLGGLLAKFVCVLFVAVLVGYGCSGSSSTDTPEEVVDNSRFKATYELTMQVGTCVPKVKNITVGNDQSREDEDGYVYIPQSSNTASYTNSDGDDVTITVSGNAVSVENSNTGWTFDIVLTFSADYSSGTISGNSTSVNYGDCTGRIKGTATKVSVEW